VVNNIFGFGWAHPMLCVNWTAHTDASVPGGSGDDAGWRGLLAAILSRAAAPAKLPLLHHLREDSRPDY
jgi:hypothetical protein